MGEKEKVTCEICGKAGDYVVQQHLAITCHYGSENDGLMFNSEKVCPDCIDKVVKTVMSINKNVKVEYYI